MGLISIVQKKNASMSLRFNRFGIKNQKKHKEIDRKWKKMSKIKELNEWIKWGKATKPVQHKTSRVISSFCIMSFEKKIIA